jgi:hypothetical protein
MKVPKAKIVKMIQEMLDTPGHVQVQKTEDGLLVVDVPGSDAKAVFSEEAAGELVEKLIKAMPSEEARELVKKLNAELN